MHPFRFGVMAGGATDRSDLVETAKTVEDQGFSTFFISDHFSDKFAPLPALVSVAENSALRVGTLVLANDFRHPVVLAKEAATVDLLSEGRLELGIGTGWSDRDYNVSGIPKPSPGVQVDRFRETVQVLKGLWSPGETDFEGDHYQVHLDGLPKPGPGRPRLLIGAGARRMLHLAGEEADIVGISAAQITDSDDLAQGLTAAGELLDEKVEWIRSGAGDRFSDLELNILLFGVIVTPDRAAGLETLADDWETTPEGIASSPHFLVGSVEKVVEDLVERRERWGISYPVVPLGATDAMRPIVEQLTGS